MHTEWGDDLGVAPRFNQEPNSIGRPVDNSDRASYGLAPEPSIEPRCQERGNPSDVSRAGRSPHGPAVCHMALNVQPIANVLAKAALVWRQTLRPHFHRLEALYLPVRVRGGLLTAGEDQPRRLA